MLDLDALTYDPDTPGFYLVLLAVLLSFFLSSIIAVTYQFTTPGIYRRAHFLQSLILIGMVAAMIMQAIGDSVARGLGILGALSIIRFRTVLDDPRNITFMFASLGVGIAAGVLGFTVALTATLVFCGGAIILRFSPLGSNEEFIGELRLRILRGRARRPDLERLLKNHCHTYRLEQLRYITRDDTDYSEYTYLVRQRSGRSADDLADELRALPDLGEVRVRFAQRSTRL